MKLDTTKWVCLAALPVLTQWAFCRGDMLVQDQFDRTGQLAGTMPTMNAYSSGDTWTAPTSYTTDGAEATNVASAGDSSQYMAAIPFDLSSFAAGNPDMLLTLSVTASVTNPYSSGSWISLGFSQGASGMPLDGSVSAGPWMILRADSGTVEFPGPGIDTDPVASTPDGGAGFSGGTMSLTYNTATNVASYYLDTGSGPVLEGTAIYDSAPADNFVGFSTESDNFYGSTAATFSDFSLSMTAVPEPASIGMVCLGVVGILGRRSRGRVRV